MTEIRPVGASDIGVLRELLEEYLGFTYAEVFGHDTPVRPADLPEFNRQEIADPWSAFDLLWLAWDGTDATGSVALRRFDGEAAELKRLYVREAYRRAGLGRRLVDTVIEEARGRGYRRVILDTLPGRAGAIALFEAYGFLPTEAFHDYPMPSLFFALELPEPGP